MDIFFITLYSLFLDVFYILLSNIIIIVCSLIALSRAKKGKSASGWFAAGILIQGIAVFGSIAGMARNPELWVNYYSVINVVVFVLLIAIFGRLIHKAGNKEKS